MKQYGQISIAVELQKSKARGSPGDVFLGAQFSYTSLTFSNAKAK